MSVDKIEQQIENLCRLLAFSDNERTLRLYCRMIGRMESKKATVRVVALRKPTATLSF